MERRDEQRGGGTDVPAASGPLGAARPPDGWIIGEPAGPGGVAVQVADGSMGPDYLPGDWIMGELADPAAVPVGSECLVELAGGRMKVGPVLKAGRRFVLGTADGSGVALSCPRSHVRRVWVVTAILTPAGVCRSRGREQKRPTPVPSPDPTQVATKWIGTGAARTPAFAC